MDIAYPKNISAESEELEKKYTSVDVCRRKNEKSSCIYPEFSVGFYKDAGISSSAPSVEKLYSLSGKLKYLFGYKYINSSSKEIKSFIGFDSSGYMYTGSSDGVYKHSFNLSGRVTVVPYVDTSDNMLAVIAAKNGVYTYDGKSGDIVLITDAPAALCAEIHSERLFVLGIDGYTLNFSHALDITDWTKENQGAGYVSLPSDKGKIIAMKSFGGYLFLFRERGITRLRAMGDIMNFQHVELDVHCGNIYADSIAETGEYIAFASDGGLFLFDGDSVKKITDEAIENIDISSVASAARYGNRALMCVKLKTALPSCGWGGTDPEAATAAQELYSSAGGRAVILVDGENEDVRVLPYPALLAANVGDDTYIFDENKKMGRLYETAYGKEGEYMGGTLPCVWDSGLTDFSLGDGLKVLRKLSICGEGEYSVTAYNESRAVNFSMNGSGTLRPMLSGKKFGVRISGGGAKIYSAEVNLSEYRYS